MSHKPFHLLHSKILCPPLASKPTRTASGCCILQQSSCFIWSTKPQISVQKTDYLNMATRRQRRPLDARMGFIVYRWIDSACCLL